MKYDHLVRHNGKDYAAGTEVPIAGKKTPELSETDKVKNMRAEELKAKAAEMNIELVGNESAKVLKEKILEVLNSKAQETDENGEVEE